jgi:hypothetical protein
MRNFIPALFALTALGAIGSAVAADPAATAPDARATRRAEMQQRHFDMLDGNHDGVVSRAEYQAWIDGRFDKLDVNHDGRVDASEIEASPEAAKRVHKRAERFVKRYDPSGSGQVAKADFEARAMQRFDRLGGGADTLTMAQFAAHRHHMHEHAQDADPAGG